MRQQFFARWALPAHAQTGYLADARRNLEMCRKWAKTEPETSRADRLARFIEARAGDDAAVHPGEKLKQVRGLARSVDCSAGGKRLQIQAGTELKTFDLPDPRAIEMVQTHGGSIDFTCGPLKELTIGRGGICASAECSGNVVGDCAQFGILIFWTKEADQAVPFVKVLREGPLESAPGQYRTTVPQSQPSMASTTGARCSFAITIVRHELEE